MVSQSSSPVTIVTGGSSGIGLATVKELLAAGINVVNGDMAPLDISSDDALRQAHEDGRLQTHQLDVTVWEDLSKFFASTYDTYSRLDYAFINAGVGQIGAGFLKQDVDEQGKLKAPDFKTVDIDLFAPMSTAKLAMWYMQKSDRGGCMVFTASSAGFTPIPAVYYTTSKHGVIGFMRSLHFNLKDTNIRVNAVAPSWTESKIAPADRQRANGIVVQSPVTVAKDVVDLFTDKSKAGLIIYSEADVSREIEGPMRDVVKKNLPTSTGLTHFEETQKFLANEGAA